MASSLGLYVEDNLIKYAKVSKSNEDIKVEAFGVKFYENLESAIRQIVEETYSFKVPISINTTEEWYNDIEVFSLLAKKDMDSAIKTEFENICYSKDINRNLYEERYIFANSIQGDDRIKAIHIAVPKTSLEQQKKGLTDYKINAVVPISVSISNLIKKEKKGTVLVVNIEKNTTITKLTNGIVSDIEVINYGSKEILDNINKKENSYFKAYEICKAATIYTESDKDLQYEENEYLEDIMPTLFKIVSEVRKKIDDSMENIESIYITGTGALVNNIDIYFQDYLKNIHCEILKPSFLNNSTKVNIKDYIEVNSAIAIGLQGIEKNNKAINFRAETGVEKAMAILNSNVLDLPKIDFGDLSKDLSTKLSRPMSFVSSLCLITTAVYIAGALIINKQYDNRIEETEKSIATTNTRIETIQQYNKEYNSQMKTYQSLIKSIQNLNNTSSEDKRYRNTIPNLLNHIMVVIPKGVQLISVENPSDAHVIITAKAYETPQIAYFKTQLKEDGILKEVVSDTGKAYTEYVNGIETPYIVVTIEGELP